MLCRCAGLLYLQFKPYTTNYLLPLAHCLHCAHSGHCFLRPFLGHFARPLAMGARAASRTSGLMHLTGGCWDGGRRANACSCTACRFAGNALLQRCVTSRHALLCFPCSPSSPHAPQLLRRRARLSHRPASDCSSASKLALKGFPLRCFTGLCTFQATTRSPGSVDSASQARTTRPVKPSAVMSQAKPRPRPSAGPRCHRAEIAPFPLFIASSSN